MDSQDELEYVGHATARIRLGGTTLLTDPALGRRVGPLMRTVPPVATVPAPDAVLVSHMHRDHLDLRSLRSLDPSVPLFVPRGAGELARRSGAREVTEVEAGDRFAVGALTVDVFPARHDPRRGPSPRTPVADPVGFVAASPCRSVYFAGDTELFEGMRELGEIDVALLPIWGWGRSVGEGHMDPEMAAQALRLIRPWTAVPIHWGTLAPPVLGRAWRRGRRRPAEEFVRRAADLAPDVVVSILEPGERLRLVRRMASR